MEYHYYISGLPDLQLDDTSLQIDLANLRRELEEELSPEDFQLIRLFYLKYDNANLMALLRENTAEIKQEGNFTREELLEFIKDVKDFGESRTDCPEYLAHFLRAFLNGIPISENLIWEDQLLTLFYEYANQAGNEFVRAWFQFEMNLNNIQVGSYCRKHGLDQRKSVVGENEIAESIRASNSKDFGLTGMMDELEEILRITDDENVYERERTVDLIKWKYLEENSFFHYFTIERIIVFLLKTEIIARWMPLNKEYGNTVFREIIRILTTRENLELVEK